MAKHFLSTLILSLLFGTGSFALAASPEPDTFELGAIVVTSDRVDVSDVAISQKISQTEIKATNSKTFADALKFAPGIIVTRGRKGEPGVSVHGFSQEKTLFLVDGIPYYETFYGKLSLDQVPAQIISRIEITKNAPSVLYGANAQVAVINVITKKGTKKPTFNLAGEIGEGHTYRVAASHGNQVGQINYWISYVREDSDGWPLSDDFEPQEAQRSRRFMPDVDGVHENGGLRENADYEKNRFWARVGLTPSASKSEYFVSLHLLDSELGHPPAIDEYRIYTRRGDSPGFSSFSRFDDYNDWGIDFSAKQVVSETLTFRGKFFYHNHEDLYVSFDGPDYQNVISTSTYEDDLIGTSLFSDFSFADIHEGHVSLHYKRDSHKSRDDHYLPYNTYQSYTGSIGTEHSYFAPAGLTLYAGVAYDWFDVGEAEDYLFDRDDHLIGQEDLATPSTESEFNPMIGFTWDIEPATVYGSVARKTQFPTLSQLYSSKSGNTELSSEQSINYTLGIKRQFGKRVAADVSGFYHDISDWISRDYYEDSFSGREIYTNVEEISMLGLESSLNIVFCDYFKVNANYTLNQAKNKSAFSVTDKVIGVAKHKVGVGFNLLIPKILVAWDVQGIYVDEIYESLPTTSNPDDDELSADNYFTVNTRLSKKFKGRYDIYAEVDNLFDDNYSEEAGFPSVGRNFRCGLSLSF